MAVEMRSELPGVTAQQAEAFAAHVGPGIKTFPGLRVRAYGLTDSGFSVTEFWESREAHERWAREVIAPMLQRAERMDAPSPEDRRADTVVVG